MDLAFRAAALCVTAAVLALVIRQGSQTMGLLLTLCVAVAVLLFLLRSAAGLAAFFQELGEQSGLSPALLGPLYKTVGIALVIRTGSALCKDAGESALAATLETAGSVCALLTALPLLREVLRMLFELMA